MSTVVRNINGVRGFCMYKNGQPYTYIYTRDAIEMLGLVKIQNNYKKLRLDRFAEKFLTFINSSEEIGVDKSLYSINLTPNFKISQAKNCPTNGTINSVGAPSPYDNVIPEYLLDRVIFAIVNNMNSELAKQFRMRLFCDIIPHFQQTATQDQIAQVPILNQTTQFMYDRNDIFLVTQQSYNFAMQILNMYINRLAILTNESDLDKVFSRIAGEYNEILTANEENNLIYYLDRYLNHIQAISGIKHERSLLNLKEAIIYNWRLFGDFTKFIFHAIRDEEEFIIRDRLNGEKLIKYRPTSMSEREEYFRVPKESGKISPVRFLSMDERAGLV